MKNINYIVLFSLLSCSALGAGKGECAKVSYISFYISLYASKTEGSIEGKAMERKFISQEGFSSLVKGQFSSQKETYMADNSKAVIHFYEGDVFIDADGRARKGDSYADIDTEAFEKVLLDKCI